jgi:hypothetical protein
VTVPNRFGTSEISSIDGLPTTFQRCAILQEGLEVSASALGGDFDLNEGIRQAFALVRVKGHTNPHLE